jgi:hypothetical protein
MGRSTMKGRNAALGLLLGILALSKVDASELLYIYAPDCAACQRFDREILPYYEQTDEARKLPIIKISLADWQTGRHSKSGCQTQPVKVTPTFIALLNCKEQDRIAGYSKEELFWMSVHRIDAGITSTTSLGTHEP